MDNLKSHVSRHFDYVPQSPDAQFLAGDWFKPKYNCSLEDLLDEVIGGYEKELTDAKAATESAKDRISELEETICELEKA